MSIRTDRAQPYISEDADLTAVPLVAVTVHIPAAEADAHAARKRERDAAGRVTPAEDNRPYADAIADALIDAGHGQ